MPGPRHTATSLSGLLDDGTDRDPGLLAVMDQPGRETWCGRPQMEWTYAWAREMQDRLSSYLARLGLPAGSPVGIGLAHSSEACIAVLAVERAGYTPCLLPLTWTQDTLAAAVKKADIRVVLTQSMVGDERPARMFCEIALTNLRLRYLLAFGPDLPNGVVDLDRAMMTPVGYDTDRRGRETGERGIVTFSRRPGEIRPVFRPVASLIAAAKGFVLAAGLAEGDRIVSLLASDDQRGLATGLAAALVGGASLECHGLFDAALLLDTLEENVPTFLVVPGWMEEPLARVGLPETVTLVLVHDAPVRLASEAVLANKAVDVLAFDEAALLAAARDEHGRCCLALGTLGQPDREDLLTARVDEDGAVSFSGPAGVFEDFRPGGEHEPASPEEWRHSGFRIECAGDLIVAAF